MESVVGSDKLAVESDESVAGSAYDTLTCRSNCRNRPFSKARTSGADCTRAKLFHECIDNLDNDVCMNTRHTAHCNQTKKPLPNTTQRWMRASWQI